MKKMMVVVATVAALAAFGQGLQTVKLSAVTNILNLPVVPGKCGSFMSVKPPAAGLPAGPLSVSDILVEVDTGRIVGGMGSYVYPAKEELELVVRAYANKKRQLAICTCLHTKGDSIRCGLIAPLK